MARSFKPELVLLDIGMPRMNGHDACRRIRGETWGRVAVLLAITGWGQQEGRRRTVESGFGANLVKPVDPAALLKWLQGSP